MKTYLTLPMIVTVGLLAVSCEKKPTATVNLTETPVTATNTFETKRLGDAIDRYVAIPNNANAADVNKAFAELDSEIAELQQRVAKTAGSDRAEAAGKLANLESYRAKETTRYTAAKVVAPVADMAPAVDTRSGMEKVGDSLRNAADNVGDTAKDVGNSIKNGAEKVGDKVEDATDHK